VLGTRLTNPKCGSPKPLELVYTSPSPNYSHVPPHDVHTLHQGFGTTQSSLISRAESSFTLATRISARADSSSVRSCVAQGLLRSTGVETL